MLKNTVNLKKMFFLNDTVDLLSDVLLTLGFSMLAVLKPIIFITKV